MSDCSSGGRHAVVTNFILASWTSNQWPWTLVGLRSFATDVLITVWRRVVDPYLSVADGDERRISSRAGGAEAQDKNNAGRGEWIWWWDCAEEAPAAGACYDAWWETGLIVVLDLDLDWFNSRPGAYLGFQLGGVNQVPVAEGHEGRVVGSSYWGRVRERAIPSPEFFLNFIIRNVLPWE